MIEPGRRPLLDPTVAGNPARAGSKPTCFAAARLGALGLPVAPTPVETTAFLQPRGELRAAITATAARLEARQAERKAAPKKVALKELRAANASRGWVRRVNSLSIRSK